MQSNYVDAVASQLGSLHHEDSLRCRKNSLCPLLHTMKSEEYWESYHEHSGALDLLYHLTSQDWALHVTNIASAWVEQQFAAHVAGKPLVPALAALDPDTMIACRQFPYLQRHINTLVCNVKYVQWVINFPPVKLDIDVIQYNEALVKHESGLNDAWEDELLAKFPPAEHMFLDRTLVVIDSGYRIILWHLPAMLNWSMQVNAFGIPAPIAAHREEPERHVHRYQQYGKCAAA